MASGLKFVAFDLGAESGRSVLGSFDGAKLSLTETHRWLSTPVSIGESLYWDVLRLFNEMKQGLRVTVQEHGAEIAGAGIDTWGVDFGLLGLDDILIENPHCYRDPRTDGAIEEAARILPLSEIYDQTGIQFMQFNSVFQLFVVAREHPWMLDSARAFLMMPDLLNFWFTGVKANEFTDSTTTQFYNPRTGTWANTMLQDLGIPTHFLSADIVPPGTVLGGVRQSVAREIGSGAIPFIAPATHDTGSAVAAVPCTDESYAYISSGTWSLMGIESKQPIINDKTRELNFTNEGGVGGMFRVLRNIMGLWLVQECRRTWGREGREYSYTELTDLAAAAEPFRSLVDPDDQSFLAPGDMPSRIREFCKRTNQPVPDDVGSVVRTALDSLALKYRWVLERLEMLTGNRLDRIHMVGGGTQNKLLCQLAADATSRPVIAGPIEATAIGNIIVQALGLGHVGSLEEGRAIVHNSFELVTYEPHRDGRIDDAFARFAVLVR
ncbi:MAG: rhamnulokinase [Armatimonadetes bacterium]|nr:rhamnulokinase [Armatimonadota bacterium]